MRAIFDHHISSAKLAYGVRDLVCYRYPVQLRFCLVYLPLKARVEIRYNLLPLFLPIGDLVKLLLHLGRETLINYVREGTLHNVIHGLTDLSGEYVLALLGYIMPCKQRCYRGSIGAGPSDAAFLHGANQRRFRIVRRGLREMLLRIDILQLQLHVLLKAAQGVLFLKLLSILVHAKITVKGLHVCGHGEHCFARFYLNRGVIVGRVPHLAGRESLPYKLIEPELIAVQRILEALRRPDQVGRPYRFMGILYLPLDLAVLCLIRHIFRTILL